MTHPQWDLKSNYMLAFSACKYGLNPEQWNLVANELAYYMTITPQNCKIQFDLLCEQYGRDWHRQTVEPLHTYVFSVIKRLYYGDLCERMTESRDLLMVMYDFIRLFRGGHITLNDINEIIQDVKHTVSTGDNTEDNERQQKIKMLERLRFHVTNQTPPTPGIQCSSLPVELLPPPPFFPQQQAKITDNTPQEHSLVNDRQVPSINIQPKSHATEIAPFPVIIQWNNLLQGSQRSSSNHQTSHDDDVDEVELSSDDDPDRRTTARMSNIDEPVANSNLIDIQDDSTFMSDEQIEINESSNIPPVPAEVSNSNDRDSYDRVSSVSMSNQSTFDTRPTSSTNDHPLPLNLQLNASTSVSSDYMTLDSDRLPSGQNYHLPESESNISTPRRIPIDDDEVARMDAEQIPERIPADITDVAIPNDNAVFVVDELISNPTTPKTSIITTDHEHSIISENDASTTTKSSYKPSRLTTSTTSNNVRKSIHSILDNLKNAKYGPNFAKPLQSFKLPDDYYLRIKKPLDIPEIRERMNNGEYDDNILLFERDVLLMFTNALCMYHRDFDVHVHAQYMINLSIELFPSLGEMVTPWKNDLNGNGGDSSSIFHADNGSDSNDTTLNRSSSRTPSITSTSSSARLDSSNQNRRRQGISNHPMPKRQRKTTH